MKHPIPSHTHRSSKELLLTPVVVSRNEKEKVLIEGSINSIRVSIMIKQVRKTRITSFVCNIHRVGLFCAGLYMSLKLFLWT